MDVELEDKLKEIIAELDDVVEDWSDVDWQTRHRIDEVAEELDDIIQRSK